MASQRSRTIRVITEDFRMSIDQHNRLIEDTLRIIKRHFRTYPDQGREQVESWSVTLSKQFLNAHGSQYFTKQETRWVWPEDHELLVERIAEVMRTQNGYREKRARQKRGLLQAWDDEWTRSRPKRVLSNNGTRYRDDDESSEFTVLQEEETPQAVQSSGFDAGFVVVRPEKKDSDFWSPLSSRSAKQQNISSSGATSSHTPVQHHKPTESLPEPSKINALDCKGKLQRISAMVESSLLLDQVNTSEFTETNNETFTIHCGTSKYETTGDQCAKILRLTIARLENLKATLRLAIEEDESIDCLGKIGELLLAVEKRLKQ